MIALTDLTEGLAEYLAAAPGKSPDERLALWESLYAARHPEFFTWYLSERCPRESLMKRLADYDARAEHMARPSQLPKILDEVWPRALQVFEEPPTELPTILFAGGFDADGFCERYGGKLSVFLQAEAICAYPEGLLRILVAHEATHLLHARHVLSLEPGFSHKERYYEFPVVLFCEGLAVAASRRACPGEDDARYFLWEQTEPQAAQWCRAHEAELLARVREVLGRSDKDTFRAYFSGARPDGIPHRRTGYYVGWRMVETLLTGRSLAELVRTAPSAWPGLVATALDGLSARALEGRPGQGR